MSDSPRIYVASLSDYNAGDLHGAWIDAAQEPEDIWAEIHAMFATSPARARGESVEEWAIHDTDNLGGIDIGENTAIERVSAIGLAIEAHGDAMAAWLAQESGNIDRVDDFADEYRGVYESEEAYAREYVEEAGWGGLTPEQIDGIDSYLNWESIARELFRHGPYTAVKNEATYDYFIFEEAQ